jgi:hypothetical protein
MKSEIGFHWLQLHFSTTLDPQGQQNVMSMFSTAIKGFRVGQCRMVS